MKLSRRPSEDLIRQFRLAYHDIFATQSLHVSNLANLAHCASNPQPAMGSNHSHRLAFHSLGTSSHGKSSSTQIPAFSIDIEKPVDNETVPGNLMNPADLPAAVTCSIPLDDFPLASPTGFQLAEFTSNIDSRRDSGYETKEEKSLLLPFANPPQHPVLNIDGQYLKLETGLEKPQRTPNDLDIFLHAPAGIRKFPTDSPITYLDKGKTYTLQIQHSGSCLCHDEKLRLKTDIWISFENEAKNKQAYAHWQRWNQMHERREGPRSGRPGAVESIGLSEQANGMIEERLIPEGEFLNGFSVMWDLDSAAQPSVFKILIKFNFLSTDFDPFHGTKGEILSLFARNKIVDWKGDRLLDTNAQVHCCRIQLFRENGAQRKSRNDLMRVRRRTKKLEEKISAITAQQRTASGLDRHDSPELIFKYIKQSPGSSRKSSPKKFQIANMVDEMNHLENMAVSSRSFSELRPALEGIPSPCFIDDSYLKKDDSG